MASQTDDAYDDGIVTIQLEDSRHVQMCFEIERTSNLEPIFAKYSQFKSIPLDSLQFTYRDDVVTPDRSPASLGMGDDGDDGDDGGSDGTTIRVSLLGEALAKETLVQACIASDVTAAIDILSKSKEYCIQSMSWFDSDGQELSTPPIYIAIDYGHADLVKAMLPIHGDILSTMKNDDDYTPLQWASWTVSARGMRIANSREMSSLSNARA